MDMAWTQMNKRTEIQDNDEIRLFDDLYLITKDGHQLDLILQKIEQFILLYGRRPRVLISHSDQFTPKQSINRISSILAQWGFDVDIGPLQRTPGQIALMAQENDVHMIVLLSRQDLLLHEANELCQELRNLGAEEILVSVFGQAAENARRNDGLTDRNGTFELMVFNPKTANDVITILDTLTRKK